MVIIKIKAHSENVVVVYWQDVDSHQQWNEACAWAVDYFGLPNSERFTTRLREEYLEFHFKDKRDTLLFLLGISSR